MTALRVGDQFPSSATFPYVPYDEKTSDQAVCGRPIDLEIAEEFKDKRVVLVAVPGAFTPTCSSRHIPGFLDHLQDFKDAGVHKIIVIAFNDAWVMNAWRRENGVKDDYTIFASDPAATFSKSLGWNKGERTGRFAIVLDKNKVVYAESEPGSDLSVLSVSSAEQVLEFVQKL